jgi:hypothetical protein
MIVEILLSSSNHYHSDTTAPTWSTAATALNTTVECSNAGSAATAQAAFLY